MRVIYTMAHSFEEARMNTGGKPVDCRKRILTPSSRAIDVIKEYLDER